VLKAMIPLGFALLALQALAELIRVWTARPTPT
jgi:TRAP-type mannitol/chloroaromatic compound transport system permease small subunit